MRREYAWIGLLAGALMLSGAAPAWAKAPKHVAKPPRPVQIPTSQPEPTDAPAVGNIGPAPVQGDGARNEQVIGPRAAAPATQPADGSPAAPTRDAIMADLMGENGDAGNAPSPQDLLRYLPSGPSRPVPPSLPGKNADRRVEDTAKADVKVKLLPEGYLVDRVGQLVRDRGRWLFVFDADKGGGEPPLVLLPNSLLEAMQQQANYGKLNIRFRVSGEVTQYQETNYLLLRKVLVEYNLDRF